MGVSKTQVIDELEWKRRADELLRTWSQEEAEALVLEIARNLLKKKRSMGCFDMVENWGLQGLRLSARGWQDS